MDIKRFRQLPLMGILRGLELQLIEPLVETVTLAGLETFEITMNTHNAQKIIRKTVKLAKGRLMVGAGTVLTVEDLKKALDSGATFIVSPTLVIEVVEYCLKNSIAVFAGALTPQEIYNAWRAGVTMVKVFPAKFFGPAYFKEIKGPFGGIELLACGGVTASNIQDFFSCGAAAVAFGASIFKKEWLIDQNFSCIKNNIKALIAGFKG